jgi:hypothetical protein
MTKKALATVIARAVAIPPDFNSPSWGKFTKRDFRPSRKPNSLLLKKSPRVVTDFLAQIPIIIEFSQGATKVWVRSELDNYFVVAKLPFEFL